MDTVFNWSTVIQTPNASMQCFVDSFSGRESARLACVGFFSVCGRLNVELRSRRQGGLIRSTIEDIIHQFGDFFIGYAVLFMMFYIEIRVKKS